MNIFNNYLNVIKTIILSESEKNNLQLPDNLDSINVEIPPKNFNCDLSTNVAMVLSKPNKKNPLEIAEYISNLLLKNEYIDTASIAKPGFINIKLKKSFWNIFIKEILSKKNYGADLNNKKMNYLIEFVSANPTGPLHVGHCRGAILGDVLSNLLVFNNHKVTREYYVNDYGNQISHFVKSIFLRIREIKYNEKFPLENQDLYPGNYLIDIAKNIIATDGKHSIPFRDWREKGKQSDVFETHNFFGGESSISWFSHVGIAEFQIIHCFSKITYSGKNNLISISKSFKGSYNL